MTSKTTSEILRNAVDTLKTAKLGLDLVRGGDPNTRMAGLRNLVVFGRAVTNVLQNLRATEPEFDEWYAPIVEEMRSDALLRYFYELRTEILKVGTIKTGVSTYISSFSPARDMHKFGQPPTGARNFFIGDALGGTGWEVPQTDGSTEKFYVALPGEIGAVRVHFADPPRSHLGEELYDSGMEILAEKYLSYLDRLVQNARRKFGPDT